MANAFDAYFRGMQGSMQAGQNAFAMEQAVQKMQRDKQLRNILAGAYEQPQAGIPAMGAAPAQGPVPMGGAPLPDYPAQAAVPARAGGLDIQNALGAMYQGGFGPEAMQFEAQQAKLGGATPSSVNEYMFVKNLPKGEQEKFLAIKRAQKYLDIGSGYVTPSQISPTAPPIDVVKRDLKPTETEEYIREKEKTKVTAKALGEEQAALADLESSLPRLEDVTQKLSALGKIATYTKAGQMTDAAARQAGLDMPRGAIARKEYNSMVDNEILPLLKQTFGAAFTVEEGKRLKDTLGDPDASPEEKDAVLRSFIDSKRAQIETKRRRVGAQPSAPKKGAVQGGYIFLGGDPAKPESWKKK